MKNLLIAVMLLFTIATQAAFHTVGVGSGELLPSAFTKINSNFNMIGSGLFNPDFTDFAVDDFNTYTNVTTVTLNGGYGWTEPGIVTASNSIVNRTMLDGKTQHVLRFNGRGEYLRVIPFGTNWQKIRFGFLISMSNLTTIQTNTLAFGLCSGTNKGYYSGASTMNFVGIGSEASGDNSFHYSNSLIYPYYTWWTPRGVHKTNNVLSGGISISGSPGQGIGIMPHFTEIMCEVARADYVTNESFTFSYWMPNRAAPPDTASTTVLDTFSTTSGLLYDLRHESTAGIQLTDTTAGTMTIASKELTFGKLNTVSIAWGYSSNMIEIAAFAIRKIR